MAGCEKAAWKAALHRGGWLEVFYAAEAGVDGGGVVLDGVACAGAVAHAVGDVAEE